MAMISPRSIPPLMTLFAVIAAAPIVAQTATPPQSVPTAPQQNSVGDSTTLTPEQLDRQWEGARDAAPAGAAGAEPAQPAAADQGAGYADLADLVLAAPVIADATIRSTARIKGAEAADVAPGLVRFYVEADVTALIRGSGGVAPRLG